MYLVSYEDLQARCVQLGVKVAKLEEENGCIRIEFDLKMSWYIAKDNPARLDYIHIIIIVRS